DHVVACVNKMDLIGFDRERFEAIVRDLDDLAERSGLSDLAAIPVSALAGDNVVHKSPHTPWWPGKPLLEHLETIELSRNTPVREGAFRFPVQLVLRPGLGYRGFAGQIASGRISVGDEVLVLPSQKRTRVVEIHNAGRPESCASAPDSVALRL